MAAANFFKYDSKTTLSKNKFKHLLSCISVHCLIAGFGGL
jgi:hypothetical protein